MKEGWKKQKLGEVLSIERGGSPRPIQKYLTKSIEGINWIKISDATASDRYIYETKEKITKDGLHKTRVVNEGDFILSNSMSFGRQYILKTTGCIHDGWLVLRQNGTKIFETEFLYYLLSSQFVFQQFNSKAAGSTVRNLNITLVSSVEVPIPPLPEQQRIVSIIDEAFETIDKAIENTQKNLQNSKELFESYLQGFFSVTWKGWELKSLSEVCHFQNGFAFLSKTYKESGLPILRITNIQNDEIDTNVLVYFDEKDYRVNLERFKVYKGDLLIAMSGATTGKLGISNSENIFYLNQRVGKFIPKPSLNKSFLYYYLKTKVEESLKIAAGSAQPNLSTEQINNFKIPLPPIAEQQLIVQKFDNLIAVNKKLESKYQQKLRDLGELKKSILNKAFAGEL